MTKKILIALGFVLGAIVVYAAIKPSESTISRELEIAAAPEALFPYINNSKKSFEWMPWADADPGLEMKYSGPPEGLGAGASWEGENMGVGKSEIVESVPNQLVKTSLNYTKPFEMSQLAEISLTPSSGGTLVRWSVVGPSNFFFRLVGIFIDVDKMVGDDFLKGLNKLKLLAEKKG